MMLVAFSLDDHAYTLDLPAVERVVRIVEVTPLLVCAPATEQEETRIF